MNEKSIMTKGKWYLVQVAGKTELTHGECLVNEKGYVFLRSPFHSGTHAHFRAQDVVALAELPEPGPLEVESVWVSRAISEAVPIVPTMAL